MKYVPGNAQHIGARGEQQDSFAFSDPGNRKLMAHAGLLALVADGMGGLSNGQEASATTVRAFLSEYEKKSPKETIPAAMHRSFLAACDAVAALNDARNGQSGATLVAAVAHENLLFWLTAGDSRLYLVRRGRLVQLSRDHNYREKLFDQISGDHLSVEKVLANAEQEHLTSYLGMPGTPEVDRNLRPLVLEPADCVVLCTDGIYRGLPERDFAAAFAAPRPSDACEILKKAVLAQASTGQDNLTVVAFRCMEDENLGSALRLKLLPYAVALLICLNALAFNSTRKLFFRATTPAQAPGPKAAGPAVPPKKPETVREPDSTNSPKKKKTETNKTPEKQKAENQTPEEKAADEVEDGDAADDQSAQEGREEDKKAETKGPKEARASKERKAPKETQAKRKITPSRNSSSETPKRNSDQEAAPVHDSQK